MTITSVMVGTTLRKGSIDVLMDVVGNGHNIGVTVDELEDLWEKLQEILFD